MPRACALQPRQFVYAIRLPSPGALAEAYGAAGYDTVEEALCAAESYAKILLRW